MSTTLHKTFGAEKRWVTYRFETVNGKVTKVPYDLSGKRASSTDENTWATYEEIKHVKESEAALGIVFTPSQMLLGIDIDHCIEDGRIVHPMKESIARLIYKADTYCELSPSKTGLHILLRLTEAMPLLANKKAPFECYTSGRYFTVTEIPYGVDKEVRIITPEEALEILKIAGYPWGKEKELIKEERTEIRSGSLPIEDNVLLERIFSSRNGSQIKALYNGDTSAYNNDDSNADMALCAHLAFWTGKERIQMERIWLASPLGARKKTQERADYRSRTLESAIRGCTNIYEAPQARVARETLAESTTQQEQPNSDDIGLMWSYDRQKNIVYTQNTENICRVLRKHSDFTGRFRYDAFTNKMEYRPTEIWRDLEDNDSVEVQTQISILFPCFAKVGKDMVYDAIIKVSKENAIDSAVDYIRSIQWDGEKRVDKWLSTVYGVEDNEYHQRVGANWLKGLVKRIVHPGCKFDYVLVLEGEQGIKKSTSLAVLGGVWHCETTMSTDSKDFFMQFQGKAIIEFSEGETLNRTEVKKMKAIITTQSDKYRPAYGRLSVDFPRRCVFAMTTNQTEYLKDETGNRRWLPVACKGTANVEWLAKNRDQLYAEAYQRVVVDNETTWEFPESETLEAQNERRIHDPNTDIICDWYVNKLNETARFDGVTVTQAFRDVMCGGSLTKALDRWTEMSIADIFKTSLNLEPRRRMIKGMRAVRWFPKGSPDVTFSVEQPKGEFEHFIGQMTLNENKNESL